MPLITFGCKAEEEWEAIQTDMAGCSNGRILGKWGKNIRAKALFKDVCQKMNPKQDLSLFHLESLLSTAGLDNVSHSWKEKNEA